MNRPGVLRRLSHRSRLASLGVAAGLAAASSIGGGLQPITAHGATGDLVGTANFSVACASGIGVGITFDGSNLWYSCAVNGSPDLLRADPHTGQVSASYSIGSGNGIGSLAYDATHNVIYAGWGSAGNAGNVYVIQLDAAKNVTGSSVAFNAGPGAIVCDLDDGLAYDGSDNTLFISDDCSTTIHHFDTTGQELSSFPWAGSACYNSGLSLGNQLIFEGSDGCNTVWVVDKNHPQSVLFSFSTAVAGDPNFRDESLTCDTSSFPGVQVMWSKEAYAPMRAHAFAIPAGSCGVGGQPAPAGYQPIPDGYQFANIGDSNRSYGAMAADYPGSSGEMFLPFGFHSIQGQLFYDNVYRPLFAGGLCYGFGSTSTYFFNDAPGGPRNVYNLFPALSSTLPFPFDGASGAPVQDLIERYHSRQLAQVGSYTAAADYLAALAKGNAGVFNDIRAIVGQRPVTVGIVPSRNVVTDPRRWYQLYNESHLVVAYGTSTDSLGNEIINVYNPNSPGDNTATLTIDSQGGLVARDAAEGTTYGGGQIGGTDFGQPREWQAVALPDLAWLDNSSISVTVEETLFGIGVGVSQTIDNQHWILDLTGQTSLVIFLSAIPGTLPAAPLPLADGLGTPVRVQLVPAGQSYSDQVTADQPGSATTEFAGNHVAMVAETDAVPAGTSHAVRIDPSATSVTLSGSLLQQQYTVRLGADYHPNYGRQLTVTGVDLSPGASVSMGTDPATDNLMVAGSGQAERVGLALAQAGQNGATTAVHPLVPGAGIQGTVTVASWTDVSRSLIYETYVSGGHTRVLVLQDNPAQRTALEQQLFQQLGAAVSGVGPGNSLAAKVAAAKKQADRGNAQAAANILGALENEVQAQSGKSIPPATADSILATADLLIGLLLPTP